LSESVFKDLYGLVKTVELLHEKESVQQAGYATCVMMFVNGAPVDDVVDSLTWCTYGKRLEALLRLRAYLRDGDRAKVVRGASGTEESCLKQTERAISRCDHNWLKAQDFMSGLTVGVPDSVRAYSTVVKAVRRVLGELVKEYSVTEADLEKM